MSESHDALTSLQDVRVSQLWRYPIKSLMGEAVKSVLLTSDGVEGDRVVHVAGSQGPLTGRTRHGLLTVAGSTGADGLPRAGGFPWESTEAAKIVRVHGGQDARLVADGDRRVALAGYVFDQARIAGPEDAG